MRVQLKLLGSKQQVPYNYQSQLTGAIHKWLGDNEWHGEMSLYSFSWLLGGKASEKGLSFVHGARMEVSAYEIKFIRHLIKGIQQNPELAFGLEVTDIAIQETPVFSEREIMRVASPVLIKRKVGDNVMHYTYDSDESSVLLTEILKRKLQIAGLSDQGVKVSFLRDYPYAQTKIIRYNKIGNRVNICPVVIEGTPEQITFAWLVGVGSSTGVGFGALK